MKRKITIDEQLRKVEDDWMSLQHVLTKAHYTDTKEPLLLKISYELNPNYFDLAKDIQEIAKEHFPHEAEDVDKFRDELPDGFRV